MNFSVNELKELAHAYAKAYLNTSNKFSFQGEEVSKEGLQTVFTQALNELGKNPYDLEANKSLIFTLLTESLSEVVPQRVMQAYGAFADVKTVGQGDRCVFKIRISEASRRRAKQFVTKVGLAGRYETFKLDGSTIEVKAEAFGGAARVEWEELLDGRFTLEDYYNIVLEGMDEAVYREIAKALKAACSALPAANKVVANAFNEAEMDRLLATADVYGHSTIYCTFEFASKMLPANSAQWSDAMKDQIWNNGAFTNYKGHNVIILPQSFEESNNAKKIIDPSLCYIIPTGAEKPVKVCFEGSAQVKMFENRDWSNEIQTYQKMGVATYLTNPGICVFQNTSLTLVNTPYSNTTLQ